MNQPNYLKLFSLVAFLAFATFSCILTANSLMLSKLLPPVLCWVATIGFFVIASYGTKLILDSTNQNIYCEKRGLKLILGLIMLIVFWLLCSMPTNTHTLMYNNTINEKVAADVTMAKDYVEQIATDHVNQMKINHEIAELRAYVNTECSTLCREIINPNNPGDGERARMHLHNIEEKLQCGSLAISGGDRLYTAADREERANEYRNAINGALETRIKQIRESGQAARQTSEAHANLKALDEIDRKLVNGTLNLKDPDQIENVIKTLDKSYALIGQNVDYINFKEGHRDLFKVKEPQSKIKRMTSVFDVWSDFLSGDLGGKSFWYSILISILVDIAAFIFFDIAFKK